MKKKFISILLTLSIIVSCGFSMCMQAFASSETSEENTSWYNAQCWSLNSTIRGELNGKYRYYKIYVPRRGTLQVSFSHDRAEDGDWRIYIEKIVTDGQNPKTLGTIDVNASGRNATVMPLLGVDSGEYYICVGGDAEPSYTLTNSFIATELYEIEDNSSDFKANPFPLNSSIGGNGFYRVDYKDYSDYYQIDVNEKGFLEFDFSHETGTEGKFYFSIEKELEDGSSSEIYDGYVLAHDKKIVHPKIGVEPGIYYVEISFIDGSNKLEYKITNRFIKDEKYESEKNDTFYSANAIELNSYIKGAITNLEFESLSSLFAYGYDCFEVKNSKGKYITVRFSHDKSEKGEWTVQIYEKVNGEYKYMTGETVEASGDTISFAAIKSNKSNLFIKVSSSSSAFGVGGSAMFTEYKISASQYVKKPTGLTAKSKATSATLSWNKVSGAKGYEIQRYSNGKWTTVKTTALTKTTVKGLQTGKTYKFRVKAYKTFDGRKAYSSASKTVTTRTK